MKSDNNTGILIKFDYNKPSIFFWIGLSGPVFVEVITLTVITISGDNCNRLFKGKPKLWAVL
jgi:hypothetical protein